MEREIYTFREAFFKKKTSRMYYQSFGGSKTIQSCSLPKCVSAEMLKPLPFEVPKKEYSKSDDEYSDPSIILDSESDDDDDCIFSDFEFPDDFTIQYQSDTNQTVEIEQDMSKILQAEEIAKIMPHDAIIKKQGTKFTQYRFLLADWLFNLSFCYPTNTETLFQSFSLMDRYLSKESIPFSRLQLVGCCCLWICAKIDFHTIASLEPLCKTCHDKYSKDEFIETENEILNAVDYQTQTTSANYFLKSFLQKINANDKFTAICSFYCEASLMYVNFSSYRSSVIAISAILVANDIMNNRVDLSPLKIYFQDLNKNDIIICMNMLKRSGENLIMRDKLGVCRKLRRRYPSDNLKQLLSSGTDLFRSLKEVTKN